MNILVCTPAYGGLVTVPYVQSIMAARDHCDRLGIGFDTLLTGNESHITRGRNNLAATFLASNYDVCLFLDADIGIQPADMVKLCDPGQVIGAAVACKAESEVLSIWVDGKRPKRAEMPVKAFPCDFLGTAALGIGREVFEALRRSHAVSRYSDPIVGDAWDFFRDGVAGDVWLSEDYGFCALCREHGIPIMCDPSVIVSHHGSAVYRY